MKKTQSSPEEKAAWLAAQELKPKVRRVTPSVVYRPQAKAESRRDLQRRFGRAAVAALRVGGGA